jgi:protein PhnA
MSDETRDSNGAILADGDNVTVIKDLKVKGTSSTIKRGTLVKSGIRLTGNPDEVECRVEKIKGLVLRTEFLKKA